MKIDAGTLIRAFLAGLVLRTLDSAQKVDAGFDTSQTLASYIAPLSPLLAAHRLESPPGLAPAPRG